MNKRFKRMFLHISILAPLYCAYSQAAVTTALPDTSLAGLLVYVENKTQDQKVKEAAQKAQQLYESNAPNDSVAIGLLTLAYLLNNSLEALHFLNDKPYKWEVLLFLYEKIAKNVQALSPARENLFYAAALYNLAAMLLNFGPWQTHGYDIRQLMEKSFLIRKKTLSSDHPDYVESLVGMATFYHNKGRNQEALPLLQQAVVSAGVGKGKAKVNQANALFLLATIYKEQHQYNRASEIYQQELGLRKEILGAESAAYALRLYITADMLLYVWEYQKAFAFCNQALGLTEKTIGKENLQYAFCLEGLGAVYYRMADYKAAVPYYEQSLLIKEKLFGKDYSDIGLTLHNMAKCYEKMGLYEKAIPLYQRAVSIAKIWFQKKEGYAHNYGFALEQLARTYLALHQYAPAFKLVRDAIAVTKRSMTSDSLYYAMALQTLAGLFERVGWYDRALFYQKMVAGIRRNNLGADHPEYAAALHLLSCLYEGARKLTTALAYERQALVIRGNVPGKDHPDYAASVHHLGELYKQRGLPDSAQHYFEQALTIREKVLGTAHPDYIKSLNSLGELAMAHGDNAKAAALFLKTGNLWFNYLQRTSVSLSEPEKIHLFAKEYNQFDYLPSLVYREKASPSSLLQQVYASELLLKGLLLNDQQQVLNSIRASKDSLAAGLYLSWRASRSLLARQYFLPARQRLVSFDSLQEQTTLLEEQLSRHSFLFRQQQTMQRTTPKEIGQKLQEGEAAIEFIRFRYFRQRWTDSILYAAIVIHPGDSSGVFVPLFEERQLAKRLQPAVNGFSWTVNELYRNIKQQRFKKNEQSLYSIVWKPLEQYLSRVHTVYLAPTGLLHRLSFQALCADDGRRLIDQYRLNQMLSTRYLVSGKRSIEPPSFIELWGDIAYDLASRGKQRSSNQMRTAADALRYWPALPGTRKEIQSIEKLWLKAGIRSAVISGSMATEEKFKQYDGRSPGVLHLATHGFFSADFQKKKKEQDNRSSTALFNNPDAMLCSSLLMAGCNRMKEAQKRLQPTEDGILTAYEIAQMDLRGTNLAVLSACNTALGDLQGNEGVIGLQRALKLAGVRQMIVSLWKVPDKETTELMRLFYQHWLSGTSTGTALRNAQLQMKKKYPDPFFWAAFVLVE